jgi:maltooligosyltrehalose trehalohydrolase
MMNNSEHGSLRSFGAKLLPAGGVRFNLWAPTAEAVDLCLEKDNAWEILPMPRYPEGWYCLETEEAGPGALYRYRIDGQFLVPDPASRFQPDDIHGSSQVIDPNGYLWRDNDWRGRPWREAVVYELHVGSFTPAGSFTAVEKKLDYLLDLGITCIELMPVADFPGKRNWGYDGVYLFAPDSVYGRPEDLKHLIDAAHARNLMVLLDVVYNHFGPEGNYLHTYASPFFTEHFRTPWGMAINFSGPESHWVRQFFIQNAIYWLEEYHFDGLRFDAVHAVYDDSAQHILDEISSTVRKYFSGRPHLHLVLENDNNEARFLERDPQGKPLLYTAQWNDDLHHALHVVLTGEDRGYYQDYSLAPAAHLGRCLAEGFSYQGHASPYRHNRHRGTPSHHLVPQAFVAFLQNHDQIGNRALGERICTLAGREAVQAAMAIVLLAPNVPLVFMGEEWGCCQPFPFFCDFEEDLAAGIAAGRRREFSRFPEFASREARQRIPDPCAPATFEKAVLDWQAAGREESRDWLSFYRQLLDVRRRKMLSLFDGIQPGKAHWQVHTGTILEVAWQLRDNNVLLLVANLSHKAGEADSPGNDRPTLFATHDMATAGKTVIFPPWSVSWYLLSAILQDKFP